MTDGFITSERLELRRFLPTDRQFVLELHQSPDLRRFIESAVLSTEKEADDWIAQSAAHPNPLHGFWCATLHDGTPVAAVLLKAVTYSRDRSGNEVEIGWRTHPTHTGHGYATEAGRVLLDTALATGHDRIIAVVDPNNHASQAVCRRIGMNYVGRSDDYYDTSLDVFEKKH